MQHDAHHDPHLAHPISHWRCPNCGQVFFTTVAHALPNCCANCAQSIQWEELGNHPRRWRCPNCGQMLFTAPDDSPPDMCEYCRDFTTWSRIFD